MPFEQKMLYNPRPENMFDVLEIVVLVTCHLRSLLSSLPCQLVCNGFSLLSTWFPMFSIEIVHTCVT